MNKFKNKNYYSLIYILSIFVLSISFIQFYSLRIRFKNEVRNPGFRSAISVKNDLNICLINSEDIDCSKKIIKETKKDKTSILFLGNSQTGAINNFRNGDKNYISILNQIYTDNLNEVSIKSFWLPNANLKEFELIMKAIDSCESNIEVLFIPIFLDDMRNDSIRNELVDFSKKICSKKYKFTTIKSLNKESSKKGNLNNLNEKIKLDLEIFNYLKSLNENLRIDIYKFRNFVLNIKPSTIRPIKKTTYESNIKALKNIIEKRNIKKLISVIYIPPILNSNGEGKIPYDLVEYKSFKNNIRSLCENDKCYFLNIENVVPNKLWGLKDSTNLSGNFELDFFHFKGDGHIKLAYKFKEIINNLKLFSEHK